MLGCKYSWSHIAHGPGGLTLTHLMLPPVLCLLSCLVYPLCYHLISSFLARLVDKDCLVYYLVIFITQYLVY